MLRVIARFFHSQLFVRLPQPTADFSGQTIVVTGSNVGLGFEAARTLVRLGAARVILAVRSLDKGERAAADIVQSVPGTKTLVEAWQVDIASAESVRAFVSRVETLDRLDAVVQNAGIMVNVFSRSEYGDESHLAVNVVGAVLVGLLLLPKLRETAERLGKPSRLAFVGSETMDLVSVKSLVTQGSVFDELNREGSLAMQIR